MVDEDIRHPTPSASARQAGHEKDDIPLRPILLTAIALAITAVVVHIALWGMQRRFESREARSDPPPSPVADYRQPPPEPRLQPLGDVHPTTPAQDVQMMKRQNEEILGSYGWVDPGKRIARIPIERSMQIVLERGLPARMPATTQGANP